MHVQNLLLTRKIIVSGAFRESWQTAYIVRIVHCHRDSGSFEVIDVENFRLPGLRCEDKLKLPGARSYEIRGAVLAAARQSKLSFDKMRRT